MERKRRKKDTLDQQLFEQQLFGYQENNQESNSNFPENEQPPSGGVHLSWKEQVCLCLLTIGKHSTKEETEPAEK